MKKQELIDYLQNIKGNPDVIFYNGFVDDWHNISIEENILSREVANDVEYRKILDFERDEKGINPITDNEFSNWIKKHKKGKWILNEIEECSLYKIQKKKIILIQAKIKGENYFDRCGKMSY